MTSLSLRNILNPKEYLKTLFNGNNNMQDTDYGIYAQGYFHNVFALERRRTERSRNPFLLMLINIHDLIKYKGDISCINKITTVLLDNTREVDIKGWFKSNYIIGIIFTEPKDVDVEFVRNKINNKLCEVIGTELVSKITFSLYVFPKEYNKLEHTKWHEAEVEAHGNLAPSRKWPGRAGICSE